MRILVLFLTLFFVACGGSKQVILGQDDSAGLAGNSSFAPDLNLAPDMLEMRGISPLTSSNFPILNESFGAGFDTIDTPPISLISLDTGMPIIVDLNGNEQTFNWIFRDKSFSC